MIVLICHFLQDHFFRWQFIMMQFPSPIFIFEINIILHRMMFISAVPPSRPFPSAYHGGSDNNVSNCQSPNTLLRQVYPHLLRLYWSQCSSAFLALPTHSSWSSFTLLSDPLFLRGVVLITAAADIHSLLSRPVW